jgi:hypothetical protein
MVQVGDALVRCRNYADISSELGIAIVSVKARIERLTNALVRTGDLPLPDPNFYAMRRVRLAEVWTRPMFQEGLIALGCRKGFTN